MVAVNRVGREPMVMTRVDTGETTTDPAGNSQEPETVRSLQLQLALVQAQA